jgi:PAS domain S-box-containing protein
MTTFCNGATRLMADERADFLLVEDDADDVRLTLHAFKSANLANTIHVARDGVEALEYLFGSAPNADQSVPEKPKLILLDLKLPRLDGHDVLKRIKTDPRTCAIPVVVLTSSSEERDFMRTYEVGADSYIVKPVDFEQFTEAVREFGEYRLVVDPTKRGDLSPDFGGEFERRKSDAGKARGIEAARPWPTDLERSYGVAMNSLEQSIIALSLDETITEWNPGAEKLYGFSAAEAVGQNVSLIVPEDRRGEISELIAKFRRDEPWDAFETSRRRKDGSLADVTVHAFPIADLAGTLIGVGLITRDVTKQKLVEEMFRLAVEACPSGMLMTDRSGVILMLNTEIERLFGYSRDELIGQSVEILVPTKMRAEHIHRRAEFALHPETRRMGSGRDMFGRRKDRTEFQVEIDLNPVTSRDGILVLGVVTDISERQRIQGLKDEFVSTVSHELRTPLTSISGSLGLLLGNAAGKVPDQMMRLLTVAHKNTHRLVKLVNDILDMEKMESGQVVFVVKRAEVRPLVEQAIEASRPHAESLGVTIRLDPSSSAGEVRADPDRLVQVVTNLLSNAIKFSPSGAEIAVSITTAGKTVRIAVRDHGPGIPANFKARVFEKFAQADATDTRQRGGTGLGLSIVKGIVTRLEGATGFSDAPGGGTIFHVELPAWQIVPDPAPATLGASNVA